MIFLSCVCIECLLSLTLKRDIFGTYFNENKIKSNSMTVKDRRILTVLLHSGAIFTSEYKISQL